MCYDISFIVSMKKLSDYFPELLYDGQLVIDFPSFDHVQGPSVFANHPIIFQNRKDGALHCRLMEWGILQYDMPLNTNINTETFKINRSKNLNIRSERILDDTSSYWYKIKNRRCLIPVTGIFEHREIKGKSRKVPYFIKPKDQEVFFLPALYSVWQNIWTFGMLTEKANWTMQNIHNSSENPNRMTSILPLSMSKEFVNNKLPEDRYREILNYAIPDENLYYHPVYPIRGGYRPDGKGKHELFDYGNLPPIGTMNPDSDGDAEVKTLFD